MTLAADLESGADYSRDRRYRYALWRRWDSTKPYALFIGLNPSTADERRDDPTLRRCRRFASDWGYGAVYMANLFAVRATDPKVMTAFSRPVGGDNDVRLTDLARNAGMIVCAWGVHGTHKNRHQEVLTLLQAYELCCLGTTKHGYPRHPLYVRADTQPVIFLRPMQAPTA